MQRGAFHVAGLWKKRITDMTGRLCRRWKPNSEEMCGGIRHPITDVTDLKVVDIGKFAVNEHNKQQGHAAALKFVKVVRGSKQLVAGMKYELTITAAADGGADKTYVAVVWDRPWMKLRKLTSFEGPVDLKGKILGFWNL
ncbi:hypothetical protein SSX86_010149 [Deinandra increscens subsp. villosa]|uniref:Cystatin domain-containing protein n=1 Tax=Deinandra increscens subsp. villosa TaxID=3103831 RepID=A0AAP0DBB1_9ASTR